MEQQIIEFKNKILKTTNLQHTDYIAQQYLNSTISLGKKRKLFFAVVLEMKKERKKKRKQYLQNIDYLTPSEKSDILKKESLLKDQIQILELYCAEIKIEQKRNKKLSKSLSIKNNKSFPLIHLLAENPNDWLNDDIYIHYPNCHHYLSCMEQKQPLIIENLGDFLIAYRYFIRHYNLIEYKDMIIEYTKQVLSEIATLEEEQSIIELNSIIDNIKYKNMEYKEKENLNVKLEKDILKQLQKECRRQLEYLRKPKKTHDYRIDILEYLIYQEDKYYYIKKLIEQIPDIIHIRSKENAYLVNQSKFIEKSNQQDEHILVKIIKLFTYYLEIELRSQDPNFISRDYYKQLYFLIAKKSITLTKEDQEEIKATLNRIEDHIKNNRYEDTRKAAALMDILELKEQINQKKTATKKAELSQLKEELKSIPTKRLIALEDVKRVDLTSSHLKQIQKKVESFSEDLSCKEIASQLHVNTYDVSNSFLFSDTVMLEGKNVAYSIHRDHDYQYYFKIHVLDVPCHMEQDSMLAYDLYNGIYQNQKINHHQLWKMKLGEIIPAITYQFKILNNGVISNFHLYPSKISVDQIYTKEDFMNYRMDEQLKSFIQIYRLVTNSDQTEISIDKYHQLWNDLIAEKIYKQIQQDDIPIILQGKEDMSEQDYLNLHYGICYLLSKLDYKTYQKIFNIMTQNQNENHYAEEGFSNNHYINILDDSNYEHFFNQMIIKEIMKQISPETIKDRYMKPCLETVADLNNSIGYIHIEKKKKNKNKQKNLK